MKRQRAVATVLWSGWRWVLAAALLLAVFSLPWVEAEASVSHDGWPGAAALEEENEAAESDDAGVTGEMIAYLVEQDPARLYDIVARFHEFRTVPRASDPGSEARDLTTTSLSFYQASDTFERRMLTLAYRNHPRGLYWPYTESPTTGLDGGLDVSVLDGSVDGLAFNSVKVEGTVAKRLAPQVYLEARLGSHQLNLVEGGGEQHTTPWSLLGHLGLGGVVDGEAQVGEDFLYRQGVRPEGITSGLSERFHRLRLGWRPLERAKLSANAHYSEISDGNFKRQFSATAMHAMGPGPPRIWAGVGAEYLSFQDPRDAYWTPGHFGSYGVLMNGDLPLARRLFLNGGISLSRTKEQGGMRGQSRYLSAGLDYATAGGFRLRAEFARGDSRQGTSAWHDQLFSLYLNGRLP